MTAKLTNGTQTLPRSTDWAFAGAIGTELTKITSVYGKQHFSYWINEQKPDLPGQEQGRLEQKNEPPFAVIGMGRCGCHVTTALAQMVTVATGRRKPSGDGDSSWNLVSRLFRPDSVAGVLRLEPIMLVGDIDETTYEDIDGLLNEPGEGPGVADRILRFGYRPLAVGGAGHVPLFAEYLTRGLLYLPPTADEAKTDRGNGTARNYLIDSYLQAPHHARLVFYVFSAGGGTGSGAAAELIRAQRYAIANATGPEPQIYFTGFAVLPADVRTNNRRMVNTGRMLVQYLADLNVRLDGEGDYSDAPTFQSGCHVETEEGAKQMLPWDGLALVSNDVMFIEDAPGATREGAETKANQYMAQQMFNLAASQFQTEEYEAQGALPISPFNYQSLRLDPQDLRNGLNGPYAIAFGATHPDETSDPNWFERMFLRAIALPRYHADRTQDLVEGISVAPENKATYAEKIDKLFGYLAQPASAEGDGAAKRVELQQEMFAELATLRMFNSCPRVVFVLTAPQDGIIPPRTEERLGDYLGWLLPNVDTVRAAIVRGTTRYFTLSMYLEGSVLMCPDVLLPMMNYIKLSWPKTRNSSVAEFMEQFNAIIAQSPPVRDEDIEEWIGSTEDYGANVPNFENITKIHDRNWQKFVQSAGLKDKNRTEALMTYNIEQVYLKPAEVAAAMRYLNYVYHNRPPVTVTMEDYF